MANGYKGDTARLVNSDYLYKVLKLEDSEVAFIAPTGKAACVLTQRGASNAKTIHSLIYNRVEIEYTFESNGKVIKAKRFDRAFGIKIPDEIYEAMKKEMEDSE